MAAALDIIIPVYNEGANILATLRALSREVKTPARVLICYDLPEDNTLPTVRENPNGHAGLPVEFVRNPNRGAHAAVMAGFEASTAAFVLVFPADDDFNAAIIDSMMKAAAGGCDIVCASRFMPGGKMEGCPWLKAVLVRAAAFALHRIALLPTHDPTSGFRLFSRRVVEQIAIESNAGFCYSIELLVKVHRLGWRIGEVPAVWFERKHGASRFKVMQWIPAYLRWFCYAFATTFLRRPPDTVALKRPRAGMIGGQGGPPI
jgi:glycosyltransferase involved in cell wall biosynthesis